MPQKFDFPAYRFALLCGLCHVQLYRISTSSFWTKIETWRIPLRQELFPLACGENSLSLGCSPAKQFKPSKNEAVILFGRERLSRLENQDAGCFRTLQWRVVRLGETHVTNKNLVGACTGCIFPTTFLRFLNIWKNRPSRLSTVCNTKIIAEVTDCTNRRQNDLCSKV